MKYLELTELKELLDEKGIKYEEDRQYGHICIYINPGIRVSLCEEDSGYYVRDTGELYEDQTIEDVMKRIENKTKQ